MCKMLRTALADALRSCQYAVQPDCCGAVACRRIAEFDRAGYRLFLQNSRDRRSLDPVPRAGAPILVQIREPTLRALVAYEDDLGARPHSPARLQRWLADEAVYVVDFWRKWGSSDLTRRMVLRFEDFVASPRESLDAVLSAAGLRLEDGESGDAACRLDFSERDAIRQVNAEALGASRCFDEPLFVEFMNLVAQEADYLGYPTWRERRPPSGPVTTIYRARRAAGKRDDGQVVALLEPFVAGGAADADVRAMLAEALLASGREVEGRRALDAVLRADPDFFDGYAVLARHAYGLDLHVEGRGYLRELATRRGGAARAREFLHQAKADPDLLRELPGGDLLPVGREAVIAGFRWVLGRPPESDIVIEEHRCCSDDDALRLVLIRSEEFRAFFGRLEAGLDAESDIVPDDEPVSRDAMLTAIQWILGRPLRSRDEADGFLATQTNAELRLRMIAGEEFKQIYAHAVEGI